MTTALAGNLKRSKDREGVARPVKKLRFSVPNSATVPEPSSANVDPALVNPEIADSTSSHSKPPKVGQQEREKRKKKTEKQDVKRVGKHATQGATAPSPSPDLDEPSQEHVAASAEANGDPKAISEDEDDAAAIAERKARKRAIREARRNHQPDDSTTPTYLTYLKTFHEDKSNWKFNKAQQLNILKHLFSLRDIPRSFNPALRSYLCGLQSHGAAQRPYEEATKLLNTTPSPEGDTYDMSTPEDRERIIERAQARDLGIAMAKAGPNMEPKDLAYGPANDSHEEDTTEEHHKTEKWERASIIWASLHNLMNTVTAKRTASAPPKGVDFSKSEIKTTPLQPAQSAATKTKTAQDESNSTTEQPRKKKTRGRKQRTRDEDIEISDSSDSD